LVQKPKGTAATAPSTFTSSGGSAWKATPQPQPVSIQAELQKGDEKAKQQKQYGSSLNTSNLSNSNNAAGSGNGANSAQTSRQDQSPRALPATVSWASKGAPNTNLPGALTSLWFGKGLVV